MILYEYPFNERVRTYLRLEQLFRRLLELMGRESALDHHFALVTMFEILEVASRADLKSDVMRDLERQKNILDSLHDNPDIAQDMLAKIIDQLNQRYASLHAQSGKTGQALLDSEMLCALRSRLEIPGGTNGFDLPAYHHWQHLPTEQRQDDLRRWGQCLKPLADAVFLLLGLLRDTGTPQKVAATNGQFQQSLPSAKAYQLLRLRIDPELGLIPEISGNRLIVSVRLQQMQLQDGHYSWALSTLHADFELTLCA